MRTALLRYSFPVLLLLFLWTAIAIVLVPVESGDAYPRYSTLRADPLGARILHDSLLELPGVRVERNFKTPSVFLTGKQAAIFELGLNGPSWNSRSAQQLKDYEALASQGARLIFGFEPALPALEANFDVFDRQRKQQQQKQKQQTDTPPAPRVVPIESRWGVKFRLRKANAAERAKLDRLPRESALYFEPDASWRVRALDPDGFPSYIEKPLGKGSVVLLAQTFALSNEGLKLNPAYAASLVPLVDPYRHIIFDEFHLGIAETGSIGTMIRRYRLQGAIGVLLLLGLLFVWRNATSLLPQNRAVQGASSASAPTGALAGRDSQQGLATLLRRSIPADHVIQVCLSEWKRALPLLAPVSPSRLSQVDSLRPTTPADDYRKVQRILSGRT